MKTPQNNPLAALAIYLSDPPLASPLRASLARGESPRYGVDAKDPRVVIRIDPDGTETRGYWDAGGNYIANAGGSC